MGQLLNTLPPLSDFPHLVELHLKVAPGTHDVEQKAKDVVAANFAGPVLEEFICEVHHWGGTLRNYYRVVEHTKPEYFINAWNALNLPTPLIESALNQLLKIKHLGVSYGSKHLRFLRPDICPVLDNVVWENFKYPWDAKGYRLLQADVMKVAKALTESQVHNPMNRPDGRWYAADVDMAIFAHLQRQAKKDGWV